MGDDKKIPDSLPMGLIEEVQNPDGTREVTIHGADCARTKQVYDAVRRGDEPPAPWERTAARCGPARVNSDAYRSGWETIFGKKVEAGQA